MKQILICMVLMVAALFCSCGSHVRPEGIPASAQWYSHPDGGVWVDVAETHSDSVLSITVYDENSGEPLWFCDLITSGRCHLKPSDIRQNITGFDNRYILFNDKVPAGCISEQKIVI
jgi:hypothetical protein